ncbi:hypothetical protein EOL96_02905 [Candidatus Saccharibacteria bacterium]|nr:hypothetical protein [Candidatus Saccharibacteria bacterium]
MIKASKQTKDNKGTIAVRSRSKLASLRYGRRAHTVKIVAVTGTYGKSTVVRLIAELLRESGAKVVEMIAGDGAPRSFETDPFLLHKRLADASKQGYDYVILEVHAALVASRVIPSLQIDTLVATSKSPELFALSARPITRFVLPFGCDTPKGVAHHNIITFGTDDASDMRIVSHTLYRRGIEVSLLIDQHTELDVASYLVGEVNAQNVAAALATVYVLGVDVARFAEGVARVERIEGNYDYVMSNTPYHVAIDRGGHMSSLMQVLGSARQLAKRRLIVALDSPVDTPDVEELKKLVDRLIVVGDTPSADVDNAVDHEEAAFVASRGAKLDDLVLLIGQRFAQYDDRGIPIISATIGGANVKP